MIDQELLKILVCPETKQALKLSNEEEVTALNKRIKEGQILNRAGMKVAEPIDGFLVREDGQFGYLIRDDIPIMLIDEAVPL